jgi:hypothetical protein
MQIFNIVTADRLRLTGRLFAQQFEDDACFAYHGTSQHFASTIASEGLVSNYLPFNSAEIIAVAEQLSACDPSASEDIRSYVRGKGTKLSFSPWSWRAARHAAGNKGGQIAQKLRNALSAGATLPNEVAEELQKMAAAAPCVFAVDLSAIPDNEIEVGASKAIYVSGRVPVDAIRARFDLPLDCASIFDEAQTVLPNLDDKKTLYGRLMRRRRPTSFDFDESDSQ